MQRLLGVMGLALLFTFAPRTADAGDPLKPYVVFVLDTSGSMGPDSGSGGGPTGSGPTSCGTSDTKLNHARCALYKIVNSYGDMVFALGRFRMAMSGTTTAGTFPAGCATSQSGCTATEEKFELLSPLVDGNNEAASKWVDVSGDTCTATGSDPEVWQAAGSTPIGGSLAGARRYWQGLQTSDLATGTGDSFAVAAGIVTLTDAAGLFLTNHVGGNIVITGATNPANNGTFTILSRPSSTTITYANAGAVAQAYTGTWTINFTLWPSSFAGFDPIGNDPTRTSFLGPTGCDSSFACTTNCCTTQCRPYITIMLTDGDATCGNGTLSASAYANLTAANLLATPYPAVNPQRYRIETKPIGFGKPPGDTEIEDLAHNGGAADVPGVDEGYYASDEAELQLAISEILDDAIRTESCNNLDDDCDVLIDEDFPGKAAACTNGKLGLCRVNGANVCRVDGTGLRCDAGLSVCAALGEGAACNVQNASGATVAGLCTTGPAGRACVPTPLANAMDPESEDPFLCNNRDDDCDGKVDENVAGCACIPTTEVCDGVNNDCDGAIDEGTTIPCGTGTCTGNRVCAPTPGCDPSPTCSTGNCCLAACNAPPSGPEVCNGLDDNCDGNADGFQQACSLMTCPGGSCTGGPVGQRTCVGGSRAGKRCDTFPAFDPRNNPGGNTGSACDLLGAQCICNPGNRTCPLNGGGTFTACVQEVEPRTEICNDLDDDCDGLVDETPTTACTTSADCPPITPSCDNNTCQPADCSINSCGGQLLCVGGNSMCTQTAGVDNNCNGIDEDCDMMTDEHWQCTDPDGADNIAGNADDCPCTSGGMCNARESCENGAVICQGTPTGVESCDCEDDDCDTIVDEGTCGAGSGPAGSSCKGCQCAFPCQGGEFPCPVGKYCAPMLPGDTQRFCLADPCFGVTCPAVNGDKQICRPQASNPAASECVSACDPTVITCAPNICFGPTGECRPDDCTTFPDRCTAQQNCIAGECVTNLCNGVTCPGDQYCVAGQCYGSCAGIECPAGQRCRMGLCQADPCGEACPGGQVCNDQTGECVGDPCQFTQCPQGQWCNPNNQGMCEDDPCVGTQCPNENEICRGGTCYDPSVFQPDAAVETFVTTGGGGGCSTGGGSSGAGLALGLALLAMRRRGRALQWGRAKGGAS